jgi:FkbM family methyltransferase
MRDLNKFNWGWMESSEKGKFHKFHITRETFEDKIYEKFFEVEEGDIVLDFGSSVGSFVYSILHKNPKHVFCLEPSELEFPTLVSNTIGFPVTQIPKGISDTNTQTLNEEIYGEQNEMDSITFTKLIEMYGLEKIDFIKTDCEGGEYHIFNPKNLEYILNNVRKISGEWHLSTIDLKNKFRKFRDSYLSKFNNFEIYSVDGMDIKWDVWNEHFINYYNEVIIYINNNN